MMKLYNQYAYAIFVMFQIEVKIGKFLEDMSLKRLTLPPYDKLGRMIM